MDLWKISYSDLNHTSILYGEGIPYLKEFIKQYNPNVKFVTIKEAKEYLSSKSVAMRI